MSSARIDPSLLIGDYRIDDCHKLVGNQFLFLGNCINNFPSWTTLTQVLLALHTAGVITLDKTKRNVHYRRAVFLGAEHFRPCITREEANKLLKTLINRATVLNKTSESEFFFEEIHVFGSYLTDKPLLGDLDIGIKVAYTDCSPVPEPSYRIFEHRSPFHKAAKLLCGKELKSVGAHHIAEMKHIHVASQCVWAHQKNKIQKNIIPACHTSEELERISDSLQHKAETQQTLDNLTNTVKAITSWPEIEALNLTEVPLIPYTAYTEMFAKCDILDLAHYLLLPDGNLKSEIKALNIQNKSAKKGSELLQQALCLIKASIAYTEWKTDRKGRLIHKRRTVKEENALHEETKSAKPLTR